MWQREKMLCLACATVIAVKMNLRQDHPFQENRLVVMINRTFTLVQRSHIGKIGGTCPNIFCCQFEVKTDSRLP